MKIKICLAVAMVLLPYAAAFQNDFGGLREDIDNTRDIIDRLPRHVDVDEPAAPSCKAVSEGKGFFKERYSCSLHCEDGAIGHVAMEANDPGATVTATLTCDGEVAGCSKTQACTDTAEYATAEADGSCEGTMKELVNSGGSLYCSAIGETQAENLEQFARQVQGCSRQQVGHIVDCLRGIIGVGVIILEDKQIAFNCNIKCTTSEL